MILQFLDANGNDVTGTVVDVGLTNNVILELVIDGEGQATPIAGNITHNAKKIGDFTWTNTDGPTVNWYVGDKRPIYVLDGDVIKGVVTSSPTSEISVTIERYQPDVLNVDNLARFNAGIVGFVPTSSPRNRLKSTMAYINTETELTHSSRESVNVRRIKEYLRNRGTLPTQNALIYGTPTDTQNALTTITPPTVQQIFSTWARFAANEFYPSGSTIPSESEAAAWYWDDAISAAVMPLNSVGFVGFISDELVDYYDHEATVTSTNADDDWNGLVLAFQRGSDNINYSLSVTVSCDGTNGTTTEIQPNLQIRYNFGTILKTNNANDVRGNGWSGKTKRLKVSRRGDQFTIQASQWDQYAYDPTLTMTINLNDYSQLARFKGPMQYGYCNVSQPASSFKDIKYFGGTLRNTIIDATNNLVYRYSLTGGWQLLNGVKAQDVFGSPRALIGPDNKSYMLETDGTITRLN